MSAGALPAAARLAWRESRGAGRLVAHALVSIALGVAALVAVSSAARAVEDTVARSARALLGGDVELRAAQPLSAEARRVVSALRGEGAEVTDVSELVAMARAGTDAAAATALVELKAVEPVYPLYGEVRTEPAAPLSALLGGGRCLVQDALLARLNLRVGDSLLIGAARFTIAGHLLTEPDRAVGAFTLGPRVLIASADLDATRLVRPGSRVRHRTLVRLAPGADAEVARERLAEAVPDLAVRVASFRQAQPGLRRFWEQLERYLGLAGLVALLVGGIGVATSATALMRARLDTVAVLKCLGASWRTLALAYGLQLGVLGLAGSALGAALGAAVQPALAGAMTRWLGLAVEPALAWGAIARGVAMGVAVTLLCALWPLLAVWAVPPAHVLRRDVERVRARLRPWRAALPIGAGLAALALWQAGSWTVGGVFAAGCAAALALLAGAARVVVAAARRLPRGGGLAWRYGVAALHRPGGQTVPVLVALGLGVTLVVALAVLEANLRRDLGDRGATEAPSFFFIDVQADQVEGLTRLVESRSGARPSVVPVVRARLAEVNGARPVPGGARPSAGAPSISGGAPSAGGGSPSSGGGRPGDRRGGPGRGAGADDAWYLTREYVLTWTAAPPPTNTVVAGRWWTAEEAAREPLISVEEEIAKLLGVGLGDRLGFDIQGVTVGARITSLRRVDWRTFGANFFVVFSPGPLDGAPTTYLATVRVSPEQERTLPGAVAATFPNVTAVPVRDVMERVAAIMDQVALAARAVAAVAVVAAAVVLAGALRVTREQRLYESVVLKAVGATRGTLARAFAVEYALLGGAAGVVGSAVAVALAWGIQRWVMEIPWSWQWGVLAAGLAGAAALAVAVGALTTYRLLGHRPLAVLRGE